MEFFIEHRQYYAQAILDPRLCDDVPPCGKVVRRLREDRQAQDPDRFSVRKVAEMTSAISDKMKFGYDRTNFKLFEEGEIPMNARLSAPFLEILLGYFKCNDDEKREIWVSWACDWLRTMAGE